MKDMIIEILLGIVVVAVLGLVGMWFSDHEEKIVMQQQIKALMEDRDRDIAQDQRLNKVEVKQSKFWKLHSWERNMHHQRQAKDGEPLTPWPDLTID